MGTSRKTSWSQDLEALSNVDVNDHIGAARSPSTSLASLRLAGHLSGPDVPGPFCQSPVRAGRLDLPATYPTRP
jgi:hypothetical protein